MMDYYSNYYPPGKDACINEICLHFTKMKRNSVHITKTLSDEFIKKTVTKTYNVVTKNNTERGSYTGWCVHERPQIINMSNYVFQQFYKKKKKFKGIILSLVLLNKAYKDHLTIYYAPGGPGMTEAYIEFENTKKSLQ